MTIRPKPLGSQQVLIRPSGAVAGPPPVYRPQQQTQIMPQTHPTYSGDVAAVQARARTAGPPPVYRPQQQAHVAPLKDPTSPGRFAANPTKLQTATAPSVYRPHVSSLNLLTGVLPVLQLKKEAFRKWDVKRSDRRGGIRKAKWLREYESNLAAVESFMRDRVAPWATQARIAELVDRNMKDLKADSSIKEGHTYLKPSEHRIDDPSYTPQIAPGDTTFLAPNRSASPGGKTNVIHRGDLEIEMFNGIPHARIYTSLWAEALPNADGKITHKDVHQDAGTGAISIYTGRDQGEQGAKEDNEDDAKMPIVWFSGGQPLRQLKWFYKYPVEKYNPGAKPVIRSFLVPLDVWNRISIDAVNEDSARVDGNSSKPFNVDTAYGANQFGIRGPSLELLRESAVPRSLISYVGDQRHSQRSVGGTVRNIRSLHDKLGAPRSEPPMPIWVDPKVGKFVRTGQQQSLANSLMFYYGLWTGNEEFIPVDKRSIPVTKRRELLKQFLAEHGLELPAGRGPR